MLYNHSHNKLIFCITGPFINSYSTPGRSSKVNLLELLWQHFYRSQMTFQAEGITALWSVPNYTAWRTTCSESLPETALESLTTSQPLHITPPTQSDVGIATRNPRISQVNLILLVPL